MGNIQLLSSPISNPTTRKIVSFNRSLQQAIKRFHANHEKIGGEGVTLSQTSRTSKETSRSAINKDRKISHGDVPLYPTPPPATKTHSFHDLMNKLSADIVICHRLFRYPVCKPNRYESTSSLAIKTASRICLPSTKAI